jgi:predicted amidohydrolase YtcJ
MKILVIADKIYASFKPLKIYTRILIENGIIRGVESLNENVDVVLDFRGRIVLPSFVDAHAHLDGVGMKMLHLDLSNVNSIEELGNSLASNKGKFENWIIGVGWDHEKFKERRIPKKDDIDYYINDKPVLLIRVDGHLGVLNTQAMRVLNFYRSDGIIRENELYYVLNKIKEESTMEVEKEMLNRGQYEFLKNGVTAIGFMSCSLKSLRALEELRKEKKLKLRISAYLEPKAFDTLENFQDDELLSVKGVKLFADGSFGSRTALLSEPYSDDPNNYGIEVTRKDEMLEYCIKVKEKKLQIAIHAIGDKALDNVLEVYEECKAKDSRIEHASLIRDDQFSRIKKVKAILVVQPHFIVSDFWIKDRLGDRVRFVYPINRIINEGIDLAFSTDSPVEPISPWETIKAAINERSVRILDALHYYTQSSAKAIMREDLGSLLPNYKADFIVVNKDPLEEGLDDIKILGTYINGVKVY